jgi:uncharacterized membrane protein YhdT
MELLDFFKWCESTWLGELVRQSYWLFPVIEAFHLVALALFGGAVLVVDLRLLGLVLRGQPVAEIARGTSRWQLGGLLVLVASGILLFLSEAVKCYYNQPFWIKMACLFLAIIFTYTVRRRIVFADNDRIGPLWGRFAALISIGLWSGVAWGGRWIGFWG